MVTMELLGTLTHSITVYQVYHRALSIAAMVAFTRLMVSTIIVVKTAVDNQSTPNIQSFVPNRIFRSLMRICYVMRF